MLTLYKNQLKISHFNVLKKLTLNCYQIFIVYKYICKLGDNSLIPNFFKNNLILPGKAIAQTSFDTLSQPVGKMLSSIKNTYEEELSKSKREYIIHTISHLQVLISIALIINIIHELRKKVTAILI